MPQKLTHTLIQQFLSKLGFSKEEIKIYTTLAKYGDLSILELSRKSGVQRTKIYRLVKTMIDKNIIEETVSSAGIRLKASDPDILEQLLYEQEENTVLLKKLLPDIQKGISNIASQAQPGTKIIFYRGQAGVKQMIWNTLDARTGILGFTYRRLSELTDEKFAKKWHKECLARDIFFRELYSDGYLLSIDSGRKPLNEYESRYIPPDILNIKYQSDIYNNIVSHYSWHKGEVLGIEIHNKQIAKMQKQIFDILWKIAELE